MKGYEEVLKFWFDPKHVPYHFEENDTFDREIRDQFMEVFERACEGLLWGWRKTAHGRLAEIIVLDQFSRNLFRGDKRSYTQDKMALILAQELYFHENFDVLTVDKKKFALMPFMHSENIEVHRLSLPYFKDLGDEVTLKFAKDHLEILEKFGRYPFRNEALGRASTPEELEAFGDRMGNYSSLGEDEK